VKVYLLRLNKIRRVNILIKGEFQLRKFISFLVVLLIALVMVACDAGGDPAEREKEESGSGEDGNEEAYEEETLDTFEDLLAHFEDSGLELGEVEANDKSTAEAVGADSGVKLTINGIEAQLFHFEDQESKEFQQAVDSNTITIEYDNQDIDLQFHANEGFAALDTDYHVDGEEIAAALDSYKE